MQRLWKKVQIKRRLPKAQSYKATKHNANQNAHHFTLMPSILATIINNALKNISEKEVFAADLRNE